MNNVYWDWDDWDDMWGDSAKPTPPPTPKYPTRHGYLFDYIDGRHQCIRPLGWNEMYSCFDLLPGEDDWHLEQMALQGDQTYQWVTDVFGPLPTQPEPPSTPIRATPASGERD